MALPPRVGRWPRRVPDTEESYYYVDNRNPSSEKLDRVGPFVGTFMPMDGQLQMPSTSGKTSGGDPILVTIDGRIWLPITSGAKVRSIITSVTSNASYTTIQAQRWADQIECFVVRRTGS